MTLTAAADPAGNRIIIGWPGPPNIRFRLLCRRGSYPVPTATGWVGEVAADIVPPADAPDPAERTPVDYRVEHSGLAAETVHYYQLLVPDPADPQRWIGDPTDRASAMVTGPYLFAERLYQLLPVVYRRFDTVVAPSSATGVPASLNQQGQLRRFLELVGGQLDQIHSTVRSLSELTDVQRVDGRLLPLLAHWLGWRLDQGLDYDEQRRQIADAPAVYHRVQTPATLTAAVRRVTGWPCEAKELVDNVAVTNRPERLNLWLRPLIDPPGPVPKPELLSTDDAGAGRPAVLRHPDGTVRLVYATTKNGHSELWEKLRGADGQWAPSRPVVTGQDSYQDPAAALLGNTVLLLWSAYRRDTGWRIEHRRLVNGVWGPVQGFPAADGAQRRDPAVAVDVSDAAPVLWLLWREQGGDNRWRVRYQRRTGANATPGTDRIRDFPDDQNRDPGVDSGVSAAVREGRLWLWWARLTPVETGPTRWRCVLRVKDNTDDNEAGWGPVTELSAGPDQQDREPVGHVAANGGVTVVFSSNRDGGWSVWRVPVNPQNQNWGQPTVATGAVFTDRSPAVVPLGADPAALIYRSSQSIEHPDRHARAGGTVDRRYSGTVTVQTGNKDRLRLRGTIDDVLTYTCRADGSDEQIIRRERADLVTPDVVALFLDPGAADPDAIDAGVARLRAVLPEFLPITTRSTLIIRRPSA